MKKIKIEADDYEKFLTRLSRGQFGGQEFEPKELSRAVSGRDHGFFTREFKRLQEKRKRTQEDRKAIDDLLVEHEEGEDGQKTG